MSQTEPIVYCLTRDRELATALERELDGALPFYFNDAARLHQAVMLRRPDHVVLDTSAIRPEYGDAGLGPVVLFLQERAPEARIAVRPRAGAERLVAAEAGPAVQLLPWEVTACVNAIRAVCAQR